MDEFLDWPEVLDMKVKQEFQQLGRNYQDGFQAVWQLLSFHHL